MLLKEDGHLDIERVKMLNEAQLNEEMDSWTDEQFFEYYSQDAIPLEEFEQMIMNKLREIYGVNNHERG